MGGWVRDQWERRAAGTEGCQRLLSSRLFSLVSEPGRFTASRCCWNSSVPMSTTPKKKTATEPFSALMYAHTMPRRLMTDLCGNWGTF